MNNSSLPIVSLVLLALALPDSSAGAQTRDSTRGATRPATCAGGVRLYSGWKDVPAPHDTLKLPKLDKSVTTDGGLTMQPVTPLAAGAVQMPGEQILSNTKQRASTVGATGLVEELSTVNGRQVRRYTPIFAPADSLYSSQVCNGKDR